MNEEEVGRWIEHHAALFQLTSDADQAMLTAWSELVIDFDLADALEASNWIATQRGAAFRTQHLGLLSARISFRKSERSRKLDEAYRNRNDFTCLCKGVGVTSVPHPRFVKDGVWIRPWPLVAVTCDCTIGKAYHERLTASQIAKEKPVPLAMRAYESRVPHWRRLVSEREAAKKLEQEASRRATYADGLHGPIKAVLERSGRTGK